MADVAGFRTTATIPAPAAAIRHVAALLRTVLHTSRAGRAAEPLMTDVSGARAASTVDGAATAVGDRATLLLAVLRARGGRRAAGTFVANLVLLRARAAIVSPVAAVGVRAAGLALGMRGEADAGRIERLALGIRLARPAVLGRLGVGLGIAAVGRSGVFRDIAIRHGGVGRVIDHRAIGIVRRSTGFWIGARIGRCPRGARRCGRPPLGPITGGPREGRRRGDCAFRFRIASRAVRLLGAASRREDEAGERPDHPSPSRRRFHHGPPLESRPQGGLAKPECRRASAPEVGRMRERKWGFGRGLTW